MTPERLRKILHVGQFAFFKGAPILGRAVTKILREHDDASFTWVLDEKDHPRVRALFPRDLDARVELLGWTDQDDLRQIYDQHGIFLFPSFFEGFGKAFIEAMARGLVVVASDAGGMRDVITDGRDGYLCEVGDVDQFTKTCVQAMGAADLSKFR